MTVAGEFSGNLNNGGERLLLVDQSGEIIRDFVYLDDTGWPQAADGEGPSLTLKYPESAPDHSESQNWRNSRFSGGHPGETLLEYALGTSDQDPNQSESPLLQRSGRQIRFSYLENSAAEDVELIVEISADLRSWEQLLADEVRVSREEETNGRTRVKISPRESLALQFWRLRAAVK